MVLEVGRCLLADEDARYAFGSAAWEWEVRRFRTLAAQVGPAGSVDPALAEHFARIYCSEARERLNRGVECPRV